APILARALATEVRRAGVVETASGVAKPVYTNYEPKAEQCAVSAWKKLNQLPLFPRLAQVAVPTAAFCSEKYNDTVVMAAEKGYRFTSYMPLVPTERISKIFGDEKTETKTLEFHPLD
ncbi:BnaCnng68620D, partial [Brassica napus]